MSTHLGVTDPITLAGPTPEEEALTQSLVETMRARNLFETPEGQRRRQSVLAALQTIVRTWIRDTCLAKGHNEQIADFAGGKIFTFGSYRLGVHGPGTDIDTLCVGPKYVTKDDFFGLLYERLKEDKKAKQLTPVVDAFVPVIKMVYDEVEIDLLYASMPEKSFIENDLDLLDDTILEQEKLDPGSVRALNGVRVNEKLTKLVPNYETFKTALRCIKHWAKNRGIYSNILGFFGGVTWALLTARICQLYPNATSSKIIVAFFNILRRWSWPFPILLCEIEPSRQHGHRVWDPKRNHADSKHKMPVITPAYPCMNSTFNVTKSTQHVLQAEIERGFEVTLKISMGQAGWDELFEPFDFFTTYKHFIRVDVFADTADDLKLWSGRVESKIRVYLSYLEYFKEGGVIRAHPHPKAYSFPRYVRVPASEVAANGDQDKSLGGSTEPESGGKEVEDENGDAKTAAKTETKDEEGDGSGGDSKADKSSAADKGARGSGEVDADGYVQVESGALQSFFLGVKYKPVAEHPRRNLNVASRAFHETVFEWDKVKEGMGIDFVTLKQRDLPDAVFEGRPRPKVTKKKKRKRKRSSLPDGPTDDNDTESPKASDSAEPSSKRVKTESGKAPAHLHDDSQPTALSGKELAAQAEAEEAATAALLTAAHADTKAAAGDDDDDELPLDFDEEDEAFGVALMSGDSPSAKAGGGGNVDSDTEAAGPTTPSKPAPRSLTDLSPAALTAQSTHSRSGGPRRRPNVKLHLA